RQRGPGPTDQQAELDGRGVNTNMDNEYKLADVEVGDRVRISKRHELAGATRFEEIEGVVGTDNYGVLVVGNHDIRWLVEEINYSLELIKKVEPAWTKAQVIRVKSAITDSTFYLLRRGDDEFVDEVGITAAVDTLLRWVDDLGYKIEQVA